MVYRESFRNLAQVPVERPLASAPVQNNKFGSWVDPTRQAQINQAGLSQEQQNVNQIGQQIAASPEHRYGLMEQYNKEQEKQNQTIRDLQPEMRRLSEQNIRQEADQITRNYGQGGEGANSFGNQYAAAVRGNNSASINMARAGNVVIPAGDALEKFGSIGAPMSQKLKSALADSDYMHQYEYMPGAINASMAGYKGTSMGDGSGGAAPGETVGGENQREGWGSTFMPGGEYDRGGGKDAQWKFKHDYNLDGKYVGNQEPTGYRGASQEYLNNIKGWSKQPNNLWVDQAGKLARMNYDPSGSGMIDSVSTRKGDTYTQRDNPDGKYTNWNWMRDQQRGKPAVVQAPSPTVASRTDDVKAPAPIQPVGARQPESQTPAAMTQNEDGTWSSYGGNRDLKQMSRNDKLNEILENGGGAFMKQGQDVTQLHDTALDTVIKHIRGQSTPQEADSLVGSGFYLPQQGQMDALPSPLAGVIDPPGAYEQWTPPKENYRPGEVMYGAPKASDAQAKPTDLMSQGGDMKARPLLASNDVPMNAGVHPYDDIFSRDTASAYTPAMKPVPQEGQRVSKQFDPRHQNPMQEGQIDAVMGDPALHKAVSTGYQKLMKKNPPLAQFLGRVYTS